jgi:hypothetical protein
VCSNRDSSIDAHEYNNLSDFHSIASVRDHEREINLLAVNVAKNYFKRNKSEYLSGKKDYKPKGMSKLGPGEIGGREVGGSLKIDTPEKSVKDADRRNSGPGQKKMVTKAKKNWSRKERSCTGRKRSRCLCRRS